MHKIKQLPGFLLPSLIGISILVGCAPSNRDNPSESTLNRKDINSNLPKPQEIKIKSPSIGTLNRKDVNSNLPKSEEVEEVTEEVPQGQPDAVYSQLVRQYGEDYESCGKSYRAKVKACNFEGAIDNCTSKEQWKAYHATNQEQWSRYNCISEKAWKEYNNISETAWMMYRNSELDSETRDYAIKTATTKRDNLVTEARTERDRVINEARTERDKSLEDADS